MWCCWREGGEGCEGKKENHQVPDEYSLGYLLTPSQLQMLHGLKREEMIMNREEAMLYNEVVLQCLKGTIREFV
jgi:hypothetical protein